jgi:hypothetical protein
MRFTKYALLPSNRLIGFFSEECKGTKKGGFLKGNPAAAKHRRQTACSFSIVYLSSSSLLASSLRNIKKNMVKAQREDPP